METNSENTEKSEYEKREFHSFYDVARRMILAGIGAVALTHDEIEEFIDKLVDRGEIARKDREELIKEMRERFTERHHGEENPAHKKVAEMMERFSVPSKKDFEELNQKLTDLEKKIDELTKSKK
jgi:polyhydroxyalkanoate synthesis regulator phasin